VSALSFLTPDATEVAARSPMHRQAAAAGARFEVREGWEVAVAYDDQGDFSRTVAFADRSQLVKLESTGRPPLQLEPGVATKRDSTWWCPVTPTRTLVLGGPDARSTDMSFVDVSSGLAAMELIGPGADELLARFCAIDVRPQSMPVAAFRPGSVARTPGYVLRTAEDRLLIMVGCALGAYLWDVVADAAEHLGGGPVA
jgi:glycine cleavage system aminomethyltransferase T